ncbi:MAG: head-tail connector protein [Bacteroidales bacterium]|jgi:hypothetical protein|nr:head-tail connector protein [Bacteroidales bacterium]
MRNPIGDEPLTLEEAKAHLNISHTLDDSYITSLIKVARLFIEQKTRQVIVKSAYTDITTELIYPTISSVSVDDITSTVTAGYEEASKVPDVLKHAILLLVYNLYAERNTSVKRYPDSIDYLINYEIKHGYHV